jgi:Domain of unknown function (DUF4411)
VLYLLDANVLIDANRDYYPLERVPEFWEWLINAGENEKVKIPIEIFEELEEAEVSIVANIINDGYAADLTDDEVVKIGRDPFLISYAYKNKTNRCIVTTESSKPRRNRANRHVPDVCDSLGVIWCTSFEFLKDLDFRTNWKNKS